MLKRIVCIILVIILFFVPSTVAYSVEDYDYEVIVLPIISDKIKGDSQVGSVQLYIDTETKVPFVDLEDVCDLIGAYCNYQKGWYTVERDYLYFKYSDDNMKLFLGNRDSGTVLLDGNLFDNRMINNRWHVDYFSFCNMFGVQFHKITNDVFKIKELPEYDFNMFGDELDFKQFPYYIFMYSGTTLSSIYQELMKNYNDYFWDYTSWSSDEGNIIEKILLSEYGIAIGTQEGNLYSNIFNDWNGWTALYAPYDSSSHYTESLINICNANYLKNIIKSNDNFTERFSVADSLENLLSDLSIEQAKLSGFDELQKIYTHSNLDTLCPELNPVMDKFGVFSDCINVVVSPVQAYHETQEFYQRLNNVESKKIDLLNKSILENQSINRAAEIQREAMDKLDKVLNAQTDSIGLNIKNPTQKIMLNTVDNYAGLVDSAKNLCDLYQQPEQQFYNSFNSALEAEEYVITDVLISKALEACPELACVSLAMTLTDGFMSWSKSNFGEVLKDFEYLAQYYFIEKSVLNNLNEKNPDDLYYRLVFALQTSFCCFELAPEMVGKECTDELENISEMLLKLDYDKSTLNINFYRDPRNNNVSNEIIESVVHYSDEQDYYNNTEKSNYSWKLTPTVRAEDISILYHYQPDLKDNTSNDYDYYTVGSYLYADYVPIKVNGKWGLISYNGEILLPTEYDSINIGYGGKTIGSKSLYYYYVNRQDGGSFSAIQDDFAQLEMGTNGVQPLVWIEKDQSIHVFSERNPYYEDRPFAAILGKYDELGMAVSENQKSNSYVLINNGKRVDMQEYEDAGNYSDGIIPVKKNGYWGYIDENGDTVIPFEFEDAIYKGARESGIATPSACNASCGYVVLCKNSEYALYDVKGDEIIPFGEFKRIRPVYDDMAWVQMDNGLWGVIAVGNKKEQFQDNGKNVIGATSAEDLVDFPLDEIISFMDGEYEIGREKLYYNVDNVYIYNYDKYPGLKFAVNSKNNNFSLLSLSENDIKKKIEEGSMYLSFICVVPPGSVNGNFVLSVGMRYSDTINYFGEYSCSLTNSYELIYKIKEMREYLFLDYPESLHGKRDTDTFEFGELYNSNPMINRVIVLPKGYTGPNTPPTPQ